MPKNILSIRGIVGTAVSTANFLGPVLYKGLKTASIKFTLINAPAYLLFFASNDQPKGQEDKIIEISKGAAAMHIIQAIGSEVAREFPAVKGLEAYSSILGCIVQAAMTGKTLISGLIRGALYQSFDMSYVSIFVTEGLYSGSDVFISSSSNSFRERVDTSLKAAYAGAGVANYVYAAVQCSFLPVTKGAFPDESGIILLHSLLGDFDRFKALDISNVIVDKLLSTEDASKIEDEVMFYNETDTLSGICPVGGFYDNQAE